MIDSTEKKKKSLQLSLSCHIYNYDFGVSLFFFICILNIILYYCNDAHIVLNLSFFTVYKPMNA